MKNVEREFSNGINGSIPPCVSIIKTRKHAGFQAITISFPVKDSYKSKENPAYTIYVFPCGKKASGTFHYFYGFNLVDSRCLNCPYNKLGKVYTSFQQCAIKLGETVLKILFGVTEDTKAEDWRTARKVQQAIQRFVVRNIGEKPISIYGLIKLGEKEMVK